MKHGLVTLAFVVGLVAALPAATTAQAVPPGDSLRLTVDGMVCSLCAYGVERRLGKVDQVVQVKVHLDSGLVVVLLEPGTAVSDSTLSEEVRRAGFALRDVARFTREKRPGS